MNSYDAGMPAPTPSIEELFWERLRRVRFGTWIFEKQIPLGMIVAPFACLERKIIIHINEEGDRQNKAPSDYPADFHVLRFTEREILRSLDDVIDRIDLALRFLPVAAEA